MHGTEWTPYLGGLLYRRNCGPCHTGTGTEGEVGELVLTTINREAMPLLRYRTRDLTRILPGDCPCGRITSVLTG